MAFRYIVLRINPFKTFKIYLEAYKISILFYRFAITFPLLQLIPKNYNKTISKNQPIGLLFTSSFQPIGLLFTSSFQRKGLNVSHNTQITSIVQRNTRITYTIPRKYK